MAGKTIKIAPGTCSPPPITADPPIVRVMNNSTLKFKNDLVAVAPANNAPNALITFYDLDDKGGAAYDDFCDGYTGTTFSVPPSGGPLQCDPTVDGAFSYTVTASGYQDLDPVIIIEPQMSPMAPGPHIYKAPTLDLVTPGLALLIGLTMGYFFARK